MAEDKSSGIGSGNVCKVGTLLSTSCFKENLTKKNDLFIIEEKLNEEQLELLTWRTGFQNYDKRDTICSHHFYYYFTLFEQNQKSCCDPYSRHSKPITSKKNLRKISLQKAKYHKEENNLNLIPGHLLCSTCRKMLSEEKFHGAVNNDDSFEMDKDLDIEFSRQTEKEKLNESLKGIDVSPLILQSVSSHSKKNYAKRKLKQAESQIKKKLAVVLKVDKSHIDLTESDNENKSEEIKNKSEEIKNESEEIKNKREETKKKNDEIKKKCSDFDKLVEHMKLKLNTNLSKREKIQILTLAPESWSRSRIATEFNVTEYLVRKARKVTLEKGILAIPGPKEGHTISSEVVDIVTNFYQDDEYSIMMPGAKDRVSVKRNKYKQKRLILCNLKELYFSFKQKFPELKIGFSKFCYLRPKWCVLAGSPGTHAVCICRIHQNMYLLAYALNLDPKKAVHQLIDKQVCNRENRECMLRCCNDCPHSSEPLKNYLDDILEDYDDDDEIQFSQWVQEKQMKLQSMTLPLHELIELVIDRVEALIPHSYISKIQSAYLKSRKENMSEDECIILMDFAENYNFVMQNEVQSYHWSHLSCSLHPTVIYTRTAAGTIKETSLCFISDDLNHDVSFVYCVQKNTTDFIKIHFPYVNKVEYFTDGCASQYKNFKTMMNLCEHKPDFGLDACWSFHATSHGKTVCDGIGGTVKRTVTKKNLQSAYQIQQITNAFQMYEFCCGLFSKISFFFLTKEEINCSRKKLEQRFSNGKTITGTRSFHFFIPLSRDKIAAKRTSLDPEISLRWDFTRGTEKKVLLQQVEPNINNFIACVYERNWWIGLLNKINHVEGDYSILLMHPHGPAKTFHWPKRQDECLVPFQHMLCAVDVIEMTTQSGRFYGLESTSVTNIDERWNIFKESG